MSDWDAGGEPIPVQVDPARGSDPRNERGDRARRHGRGRPRDDEDLAALVTALEETLDRLRDEVDPGSGNGDERRARGRRSRRSDSPTLLHPPNPRELLRFTETYTIPTVVAFLEAAIRALELLAGAIRLLDGRDPRGTRHDDGSGVLAGVSTAAGERAAAGGREALARVDDALAELQRAYEGEPDDPTARRLLADARDLRDGIDDRLSTIERDGDGPDGERTDADHGPEVDVDAELASLKEQAGRGDGDDQGGGDDDDRSAPGDGAAGGGP